MKIDHNPNSLEIRITDLDRALWLDGSKAYYATSKDYRPDINPFDLEDVMQSYYALDKLTNRKTGTSVNEALDNLKSLAELYIAYANHTLGLIIKTEYGKENLAGQQPKEKGEV